MAGGEDRRLDAIARRDKNGITYTVPEFPQKLGLPPGRKEGLPLPVRTGGGGLLHSHKRIHASPPTLLTGEITEPQGEASATARPSLCEGAKERGCAPPSV